MAEVFGHEKLKVYQKAKNFVSVRKQLLDNISRRVSACDHLSRGAESILLNIAHASSSWSPKDRIVYIGHANGSALECAACLDVFVAKRLLTPSDIYVGKRQLSEIVSMFIAMKEKTSDRVREDHIAYLIPREDRFFSHENLDVYQLALRFTEWMESVCMDFSCSADLRSKLGKSSTSIVLNIAEGNGRFSEADQAKFLGVAYRSAVQSSSLMDLATSEVPFAPDRTEEGQKMLRRIAAMLTSLSKASLQDT
jgi:four helix bundle protein